MNNWFFGGALALAALVVTSRVKAPSTGSAPPRRDIDALTKMLIAETSFTRNKNEMAQIVFVAVNRSRKRGIPLLTVVTPPGRPTWNTGAPYRRRFENARSNPRWSSARAFVQQVLAGAYRNRGATSFVHPSGMPKPPCSANRRLVQTRDHGARCLPEWIVGAPTVGGAMFA